MREVITDFYIPLATLITYSLITPLVNDLEVLLITTSLATALAYYLIRKYFTLITKGLATFLIIYLLTSLITQYLVLHNLNINYLILNALKILGMTYLALICLGRLSNYLVIKYLRRSVTSLITQLLVATKSMTYVLATTPELLHVVKTNYGLGKGFRARVKSYVATAKVATLNVLLRTLQYYESLITRLGRIDE